MPPVSKLREQTGQTHADIYLTPAELATTSIAARVKTVCGRDGQNSCHRCRWRRERSERGKALVVVARRGEQIPPAARGFAYRAKESRLAVSIKADGHTSDLRLSFLCETL